MKLNKENNDDSNLLFEILIIIRICSLNWILVGNIHRWYTFIQKYQCVLNNIYWLFVLINDENDIFSFSNNPSSVFTQQLKYSSFKLDWIWSDLSMKFKNSHLYTVWHFVWLYLSFTTPINNSDSKIFKTFPNTHLKTLTRRYIGKLLCIEKTIN